MNVLKTFSSPNFDPVDIPVEFLILHYTACDLRRTLEIFLNRETKVTAHFVLDRNGDVYDLGGFKDDKALRGAHAGKSQIEVNGESYSALNNISIGIEIINLNGNVLDYTGEQYQALTDLILQMQTSFPPLQDPSRIVGHEHIAGWRGKADPGLKFDWDRLFKSLHLKPQPIHARHACTASDIAFLTERTQDAREIDQDFWTSLSTELEQRIAARNLKG
jgi:N-acetyl-anhydromuramyl-L-alanine amidase AmpD